MHRDWTSRNARIRIITMTPKKHLRAPLSRLPLLEAMQAVMGPLPYIPPDHALNVRTQLERRIGKVTLRKIAYDSEPNDTTHAWLLVPDDEVSLPRRSGAKPTSTLRPAVLCLHQTTFMGKDEPAGVGGLPNLHYGLHLAQRGFVTLCPDYFPYGEAKNHNPYHRGYVSGSLKGIVVHKAGIDVLQKTNGVDGNRIGVIGHSLGGHNSLFVAPFDQRIKAVATSCGFTLFTHDDGGDIRDWTGVPYMPRISTRYRQLGSHMPFDFHDILAVLAPVPIFINAPTHDSFRLEGVELAVATARKDAEDRGLENHITLSTPKCEHDFPEVVRDECYAWLMNVLGG
jgi:dienelactone hydrolase